MKKSDNLISSVFRKEVLDLSAYKVADASGLIKLDAMENPYTWPIEITDQWLETLRTCELNRYPDPAAKQLTATIKKLNDLSTDLDVLLGNGSDEIIQILLMSLPVNSTVLAPEPGFVMYRQIAQSLGLDYLGITLQTNSFELDMPAMRTAIKEKQPAIIFIAYPNNPTGNLFDRKNIREILQLAPGLVIIDEAYTPFANASFMDSLNEYGNLLVMRTVSKLGLAGLRLGYLAGAAMLIEQLNKIRLPYNINSLTQISTDFALTQPTLFDDQIDKICSERTRLFDELDALDDLIVYPSSANFILFKSLKYEADKICLSLKEQGILIKNLSLQKGVLTNCLRVTIGKPEENKSFLVALRKCLLN